LNAPELAIGLEPFVERRQRLGTDSIEASLRVSADFDQAGVLEDSKVLGYGGLA
jgi:hypothetical protein